VHFFFFLSIIFLGGYIATYIFFYGEDILKGIG
jgi:hypothetical protein